MNTITRGTLHNSLKAVSMFACADETRSHLHGVHLEIHDGKFRIVATDGNTMAITIPEATLEGAGNATMFLSVDDTKSLAKLLHCKRADQDEQIEFFIEDKKTLRVAGPFGELKLKRPDVSEFPPWRAVVPEKSDAKDQGAGLFGLAPKYLERLGKAAKAFGANNTAISVEGALDPVRFDMAVDGSELIVIIMPMRI